MSRWRSVASVVVCLGLLGAINWTLPPTGVWTSEVHGPVGQPVVGAKYDVTVHGVVLADQVSAGINQVSTEAVLLAVDWQAAVKTQKVSFHAVLLRTADGLEYEPLYEFANFGPPIAEPGFTARGVSVFELPADLVAGADLVIGPEQGVIKSYGQAVVVDDLVDDETTHAAAITLNPASVEPTR